MRRRLPFRALGVFAVVVLSLLPACSSSQPFREASCDFSDTGLILAAQSVPSATLLPCIKSLPIGWTFGGTDVRNGLDRFWLDSDRAGIHAVEVSLARSCNVGQAVEVSPAPDEAGTKRYEEPVSLPPHFRAVRYYTFPGGCVSYRYSFQAGASSTLVFEADEALSFLPRAPFVKKVETDVGQPLCGAGAPPCMP
jgi:hypothetical protein